jgi:hypothetical protein
MRETAKDAFRQLGIPQENRAMLCLDGGGIRGIMTIQLLKELERRAGVPCHRMFDMVAGTSTGGIIAGLIAAGHTAIEVEDLYETFLTKVFRKRSIFANQFVDPPAWSKGGYRQALKDTVGDQTLEQVSARAGLDILITAHDVAEGEETFFSYLQGRPPERNAYSSVLLRAVMEATMSAPTYFTPLERFVDGGTTTFNNPALAAILEAVQFGTGDYAMNRLTILSFGTGCRTELILPEQVPDPPGPDAPFWLGWVMNESGNDASDMQSDLLRSVRVCGGCDYRRFQISLDTVAMGKLPDLSLADVDATDAGSIGQLSDKELSNIHLDNVAYFPVMQVIGHAFVQFLQSHSAQVGKPTFGYDLVTPEGKELLVTRQGDVKRIARQMGDPQWLDEQPE